MAELGAGGLTKAVAETMKCFDLKKLGDNAWALVADDRDGAPCPACAKALRRNLKSCTQVCKHQPPPVGKRGKRDRSKPGDDEERLKAERVAACDHVHPATARAGRHGVRGGRRAPQ